MDAKIEWIEIKKDNFSITFSNGSQLVKIPLSLIQHIAFEAIESFKLEIADE